MKPPRDLPRDKQFPDLPDRRAVGRWLRERDAAAEARGFTSASGYRPGYLAYITDLAERTGEHDAMLVLDRIREIQEAIAEAKREQDELRDVLQLWIEAIDGGWTGVWPLNRPA